MPDKKPLDDGKATRVDENTLVATFAKGDDMEGWRMTAAYVDESGFFLTIQWTKEEDGD